MPADRLPAQGDRELTLSSLRTARRVAPATGHRSGSLLRSSLWIVSVACMAAALLAGPALRWVDDRTRWELLGFGADGARSVLGVLSASLLTFLVFCFSILLLCVQLAGAQLSPRIIARVFEGRLTKWTLGVFTFSFTYSLAALGRVEDRVPQLPVLLAILLGLLSVALFLYLIQTTGRGFRPSAVLASVGADTRRAIDVVYPQPYAPRGGAPAEAPHTLPPDARSITHQGNAGVVVSFDAATLADLSARSGCVVELVPQIGDFLSEEDALFRVSGAGADAVDADALRRCVALGPERTLENDPAFGFRIIVDIAIKALSPAINDPTTAVLGIDQLERLLHLLGRRRFSAGVVPDPTGEARLVYRTPGWGDFVALAVTEIRLCAGQSVTVYRRLQAMVDRLLLVLPEERAAVLREESLLLRRTVERALADPQDRALAGVRDMQGLGSPVR